MNEKFEPTKDIKASVKASLLNYKAISVLDAVRTYHTVDLRKIISRLRKEGLNIGDRWLDNAATGKKFKEYFLACKCGKPAEFSCDDCKKKICNFCSRAYYTDPINWMTCNTCN